MERKFLESLGIEKEAIDKIMAENGKDIETQKALTAAETQKVTAANDTIKRLQETVKKFDGVDVEKLKGDLATLQKKYDDDVAAAKLDNALNLALTEAKAKNPKLAKAALDLSCIKLDGEKLLGLDEQLKQLKESDGYLFQGENTPGKLDSAGEHGNPLGGDLDKFAAAAMKGAGLKTD